MRIEERKGPFKTLDILHEEPTAVEVDALRKRYGRVGILSHRPLELSPGYRLKQKKTPNIYLQDPMETIFSRFRDTFRNEIRRSERLPDFSVVTPDDHREEIYRLYRAFEIAQKRAPYSKKHIDHFLAASAYYKGRLISCVLFFLSGNKMRVRSIFSSRLEAKDADRELYQIIGYATKRLIYEICKYGKEHGAVLLDLASINLTNPEREPIARFKSGFGGLIEDEYQYTYSQGLFYFLERLAAFKASVCALVIATVKRRS